MCKSGVSFIVFVSVFISIIDPIYNDFLNLKHEGILRHQQILDKYYNIRKHWKTSNLGTVLFKNSYEYPNVTKQKKSFVIVIWQHWKSFQQRLIHFFGPKRHDPFDGCSVNNCRFTPRYKFIQTNKADAIIFYLYNLQLPNMTRPRNRKQLWIFYSDESPINALHGSNKTVSLTDLANIFNWSMTYRSDSEIPIPYGRTVPLPRPVFPEIMADNYYNIAALIPNWESKIRDTPVSVLMTSCRWSRLQFLKKLQKYLTVDFYGKCSPNDTLKDSCPGHFRSDCDVISKYLFYLSLENSGCRQYLTEKIFHNALAKGAIPVIRGPPLEDCQKLLPPNSFLHVEQFRSIRDLARAIKRISTNDKSLLSYHRWRNHFNISNEHGYMGSKARHVCRICEALNYNDMHERVYDEDEIKLFLDRRIACTSNIKDHKQLYQKFIRIRLYRTNKKSTQSNKISYIKP